MIRTLLAITALSACVPTAPAEPSFQVDVLPILAANCIRCHGYPALGGAPAEFRLDAFADTIVRDGAPTDGCGENPDDPTAAIIVCGAAKRAALSSLRTRDEAYPMPPRFPMDDYQIEVLEQWARDPGRGEPRALNSDPTIEIVEVASTATRVALRVVIDDRDGDIVSGVVHAIRSGDPRVVVGPVGAGHVEIGWDTTSLARGTYQLFATLDDGAAATEVALGAITLEEQP
jgi:hypothetical protein